MENWPKRLAIYATKSMPLVPPRSPYCLKCNNRTIETLYHIFMGCPHTKSFLKELKIFILMKIDPLYRDNTCSHLITINHSCDVINYLNMSAKWYISKQFQREEPLSWHCFRLHVQLALHGEKESIRAALQNAKF